MPRAGINGQPLANARPRGIDKREHQEPVALRGHYRPLRRALPGAGRMVLEHAATDGMNIDDTESCCSERVGILHSVAWASGCHESRSAE